MTKWLLILLLPLALAACSQQVQPDEPTALANPDEWHGFGRTGGEQHYSPLDQIDRGNVDQLQLAWFADLPPGNSATGPIMAQGKVFITTGHGHIRAFDAQTGKRLWDYDTGARLASSPAQLRMGWGPKGLAYHNGRVFLGTHDGRVVAVGVTDGKLAWERRDYPNTDLRYTDGPVRVFDGKVIVGHGGADYSPLRGFVTAYDAASGERLWRFYTVPGDDVTDVNRKAEKLMRATWPGGWTKDDGSRRGGGGTAWNAFSYDPELDLIYIGVGNGFPYNQTLRSPEGGDNLFLSSIVAVKADTGEYVWHYQLCPAEQWDCTATHDMSLATLTLEGKPRRVLLQAPKNGFFYVIDRETGELISAEPYADKITWAKRIDMKTGRPVEAKGLRYHGKKDLFELWPSVRGAHGWAPQSYSPRTGLVYIPVMEGASLIGDAGLDLDNLKPASVLGVVLKPDLDLPSARRGFLKAWDPVKQEAQWSVEVPGNWPGGTMTTAGDLVFQGKMDGRLVAHDALTGVELWSFSAGGPIVAPPISYRLKGKQYITVVTGNGAGVGGVFSTANSSFNVDYYLPRRVLTFALNGVMRLPKRDSFAVRPPLDDRHFEPDTTLIKRGNRAFGQCANCHGHDALAAGTAPDLRTSPAILDETAFIEIVQRGALVPAGMPAFGELDASTLEAIRHYLRARAKDM